MNNSRITKLGLAVVMVAVAIFNLRTALLNNGQQLLHSFPLEALATGEFGGDGSGDSYEYCHTEANAEYSWQCCEGRSAPIRVAIMYACKGNQMGICTSGVLYYYYDCTGAIISELDQTKLSECK